MPLSGPEAQQIATYIGWLMHCTGGGVVAGAFFVIPSIFVLLALLYTYAAYGNLPMVAGALAGFKPLVATIVVEAVLRIGKRALKKRAHIIIAAAAFVAIYFLHVPFTLIVLAAGLTGFAGARFPPLSRRALHRGIEREPKPDRRSLRSHGGSGGRSIEPGAGFRRCGLMAAVLWPRSMAGGTDWFATAMSAAALVALYRFKLDVLWVVLAGGLIGLLYTLWS